MSSLFSSKKETVVDQSAHQGQAHTHAHTHVHAVPVVEQTKTQTTVETLAPIVHEHHVNATAQQPIIKEQHITREKHIVQEQPIIEKTIVHEQPIIQNKQVIHEKPVIHEKTIVQNISESIREAPIVRAAQSTIVHEKPTIIKETPVIAATTTTTTQQPITAHTHTPVVASHPTTVHDVTTKLHDTKLHDTKLHNDKLHTATDSTHTTTTSSGGLMDKIKHVFGVDNVPRPCASTTYDYGASGSATVVGGAVPIKPQHELLNKEIEHHPSLHHTKITSDHSAPAVMNTPLDTHSHSHTHTNKLADSSSIHRADVPLSSSTTSTTQSKHIASA